jgi:RNA polymerase sigma factor (sigma-70 family)
VETPDARGCGSEPMRRMPRNDPLGATAGLPQDRRSGAAEACAHGGLGCWTDTTERRRRHEECPMSPLSIISPLDDRPRCETSTFEATYAALGPRIRHHLLSMTRDPDLADDLVQEAFLRLIREVEAGRAPDNTSAWLYRTASNLAVSRARRASVARRMAPHLVVREVGESPEAAVLAAERSARLQRALACLNDAERNAVVLAAHGATGPEIALRLGKTPMAIRSMLYRARGRLRLELTGDPIALAS